MIEKVAEDIGSGGSKLGGAGFDKLVAERGLNVVGFAGWKQIEEAETQRARAGAPREKFVDVVEMIGAVGKG